VGVSSLVRAKRLKKITLFTNSWNFRVDSSVVWDIVAGAAQMARDRYHSTLCFVSRCRWPDKCAGCLREHLFGKSENALRDDTQPENQLFCLRSSPQRWRYLFWIHSRCEISLNLLSLKGLLKRRGPPPEFRWLHKYAEAKSAANVTGSDEDLTKVEKATEMVSFE